MRAILIMMSLFAETALWASGPLKGRVTDAKSGEPLFGVTVQIDGTTNGAITDFDGYYTLPSTPDASYYIVVKYVGYETQILPMGPKEHERNVAMAEESVAVETVTVVAQAKQNTENAMLKSMKASLSVESGVSAQQITKAQDKDASEVIRRIPGISIIDDKFVMVRGLSQRYNNVWINGGSVPSSEADSRAFSFDIIPASQIDNMVIVKSPTPEYPADFTGGFSAEDQRCASEQLG